MCELNDKENEGIQKKTWKKIGACVLVLLLLFICSSLLYVTKRASTAQKIPDSDVTVIANGYLDEETAAKMKNYWTIAVFGVDSRDGELLIETSADPQIVITINKENGEVHLASVYRDTLLMSDVSNEKCSKINASYAEGDPKQAVMALNENLDLDITDYITFSWKAAADAVNILGGIDVNITKAEFIYMNAFITETVKLSGVPSTIIKEPGICHLDGVQVIAYSRLRLIGDNKRQTERQRNVAEKIMDKIRQADRSTIKQLLEIILSQVDTSITGGDFVAFGKEGRNCYLEGTMEFPEVFETASLEKHGECLIPNTLQSNVMALHRFLYKDEDYRCSERVREIEKEIEKEIAEQAVQK